MSQSENISDLIVIGGGPAGLFTAFYAGMRQMSVKIIESLPQLGGQLAALYPEKFIYDIAGFPKVRAQELVDNLKSQMEEFEPIICLEQSVEKVEKQADGLFKVKTNNQQSHYAKTIIITAGSGAFQPRRIQIEGAEKYEKENLHYFISDLNKFKDKRVVLFGGGDSAVDWALMLEPIAKEVTIVHRRDKFRAHEHSVEKLKSSTVTMLTSFIPIELIGNERIEQVVLEKVKDTERKTIDVDEVVVNYGFISSLGPIQDWGLEIEKNSIVVNHKMETNIKGMYAVGDICSYEGKIKLIATGFGEAPVAVSHAKIHIDPTSRLQPLHSTSVMGDKEPVIMGAPH
jgi:thioredoxin reductase (NADPH)